MTWKLLLNITATILASLAAAGVTCHFWPPSFELFASDKITHAIFFGMILLPTSFLMPGLLLPVTAFAISLTTGIELIARDHFCPSDFMSWSADLIGITSSYCIISIIHGVIQRNADEQDFEIT